ncbi:hypothetical protein H6F86_05005 [Phormidium sp. FACHB-592]|uniref:Uncharacterized protein n=1 Tax=Stenomitos frigidus AS-A4 TaxID=2933935 RepID=A0ABV0KL80_9CYAN|nr:hypothetical protein [Phormidium sp. FACHB-592]MBD2073254.1 hypothetical protein [Phormidium sp. FACHB-592]
MSLAKAIAFKQMHSPDNKEGILSHVAVCAKTQLFSVTGMPVSHDVAVIQWRNDCRDRAKLGE